MTGAKTNRVYKIPTRESVRKLIESFTEDERAEFDAGYEEYREYLAEVAAHYLNYEAANYVRHAGDAFVRLFIARVAPRDVIELPVFAIYPRDDDLGIELNVGRKPLVERKKKVDLWRSLALQIKQILKR